MKVIRGLHFEIYENRQTCITTGTGGLKHSDAKYVFFKWDNKPKSLNDKLIPTYVIYPTLEVLDGIIATEKEKI